MLPFLWLAYLAHYLSDYPLQTNWVYRQKCKGWIGGLPHGFITLILLVICLLPWLNNLIVWVFIGIITLSHYIQDYFKIRLCHRYGHLITGYFIDQGLHVLWIFIAWYRLVRPIEMVPFIPLPDILNTVTILSFMGAIWVTFVWEVTILICQREKSFRPNIKKMGIRLIIYSVLLGLFLFYRQ